MSSVPEHPAPPSSPPRTAATELQRWVALQQTAVLDTAPEPVYDALTTLAATICGTPISLISLVDSDRQWFKSNLGLEATETPRAQAFCAHAIQNPHQLLEVPDARQDVRFASNPLVTQNPNIRFYAGAPILTEEGLALGTLCVIDRKPGQLSDAQRHALATLARLASGLLQSRRQVALLEADGARYKALFRQPLFGVLVTTLDGEVTEVNDRYSALIGRSREQVLGATWWQHALPGQKASHEAEFQKRVALGEPFRIEQIVVKSDDSQGLLGCEFSVLRNAQQQATGVLAVVEDLRERSLIGAHYLASADRFSQFKT